MIIEYGISEYPTGWVRKAQNLTDALRMAKDMSNPDQWRIMERAISPWTEVE